MIEVNLIPDVKKEWIHAQKVRTIVTSFSIIITIAVVAMTVVLGMFTFGVQTLLLHNASKAIDSESAKLQAVPDIGKILTIQNQAKVISETHSSKPITSRLFEVISATNPPYPNNIAVSTISLDTSANQIVIEAQSLGGYRALETYNKTLIATKLVYQSADASGDQSVPLASNILFSNVGYGRDSTGRKVLGFTLTFTYANELLDPASKNVRVGDLKLTNVTDSQVDIPESLFTSKAAPIKGGDQ